MNNTILPPQSKKKPFPSIAAPQNDELIYNSPSFNRQKIITETFSEFLSFCKKIDQQSPLVDHVEHAKELINDLLKVYNTSSARDTSHFNRQKIILSIVKESIKFYEGGKNYALPMGGLYYIRAEIVHICIDLLEIFEKHDYPTEQPILLAEEITPEKPKKNKHKFAPTRKEDTVQYF